MALQQINWSQINTEQVPLDASGSGVVVILGGTGSNYLEAAYIKNLYTSGSLTIGGGEVVIPENLIVSGNLTVRGTTTTVDSTVVTIGDNIVELNGTEGAFGGLLIKDTTAPNTISGSLLWDTTNDRWIAGPLGNEVPILLSNDGTENTLQKIDSNGFLVDSRITDDNDIILLSGNVKIVGDLRVEGSTTLVQTTDSNMESLIVSGAMNIVRNELTPQIVSASLSIQNLGTFADRSMNSVIDCGDGFF